MPLTRRDFVRTLFAASQTALVGKLMTGSLRAEDTYAGALNFAVIGDWGRKGEPDQARVAQQMGLACAQSGAGFVISLGDNFYEDGVKSVDDEHWVKSFEGVYTSPSLQVPWYATLGNHDYKGNVQAQADYARTSARWKMPARYWRQVMPVDAATGMECFFIDTTPMLSDYARHPENKQMQVELEAVGPNYVPQQLAWLDHALGESTAAWKLVFGHHPIYSAGLGHGNQPDLIAMLLPILQKHHVPAYFAGHDHDLEHLQTGDLTLIVSGGGSRHLPVFSIRESKFSRAASGFTLVSLRAHEMQVRFIDDQGKLLHTAAVPRVV
ncbi:MAG TPA: tartrate-resistant acid phosphatase type 5 family protein [Candidatus Methylacidiphilales bacterium]|jgi:acid phosphatase|nr:tartrate-resistant acid phosphatase type 5 family protein [Candidatus Methylacidiphilales bacterium]